MAGIVPAINLLRSVSIRGTLLFLFTQAGTTSGLPRVALACFLFSAGRTFATTLA
jgi:hypothetical protein